MRKVLVLTDKGGVSEFYRTVTPYRLLEDAGHIEVTFDTGTNPQIIEALDGYDAVVFSRSDSALHHAILMHCKARGIRTILDLDDNLFMVPPSLGVYDLWRVRGSGQVTPRLWYLRENIRQCDVFVVSTDTLGRQLCNGEPYNFRGEGDYLVLQNQVLTSSWQPKNWNRYGWGMNVPTKPADQIWVGWWGIYHHWDDWRDVAPYIEPVLLEYDNVRLYVFGFPEVKELFPHLHDAGQLLVGQFVAPARIDPYRAYLRQMDVCIAPVSDCPFNRGKSDLKVLQYGAAGVPVIASPVAYQGWQGYVTLPDSLAQWTTALSWALRHPDAMDEMAQRLHERVISTRTYEGNYEQWLQVFE